MFTLPKVRDVHGKCVLQRLTLRQRAAIACYLPLPSILVASSSSFSIRSNLFLGRGAVVPKLLKCPASAFRAV